MWVTPAGAHGTRTQGVGVHARAALKAFAWSFADKDGVKFVLDGVQKTRDGQAFGGKKPADQMFGVIEGDDGNEDFEAHNDNLENVDFM